MAKEEILEKVKEVRNAPSCYEGLKKVCDEYLAAAGTAQEAGVSKKLKAELKEDVCSIDHVIPFFESEEGTKVFGADQAKALSKAAHEAKDKGVKYCICPACTAGGWLLDHQDEF
ncbi:heat-shock protein Hsp90 [Dialister sp.]|jgi:hypothetical protein|uniref:heat-shock protein Hsp90 n=1 Tax=Dialister sp. TaxID=1955814 RepID=UPI003A5C4930